MMFKYYRRYMIPAEDKDDDSIDLNIDDDEVPIKTKQCSGGKYGLGGVKRVKDSVSAESVARHTNGSKEPKIESASEASKFRGEAFSKEIIEAEDSEPGSERKTVENRDDKGGDSKLTVCSKLERKLNNIGKFMYCFQFITHLVSC